MDPITKPSFLRRLIERRILRGVGTASLVGGTVGLPLLLACSCPTWVEWHVRTMPEAPVAEYDDETCLELCGPGVLSCRPGFMAENQDQVVGDTSSLHEEEGPRGQGMVICEIRRTQQCGIGRRPGDLQNATFVADSQVGGYFAQAAHLEAAAIAAFVELAMELEAHGAPSSLVRAAERAAVEEIRHAEVVGNLAMSLGQRPVVPMVTLHAPRPLETVLRDNRVEGGVVEAYGALVAHAQSQRAHDGSVRNIMTTIAREESGHANLSYRIDEWGAPLLSPRVRRSIDDQASEAKLLLSQSLESEPDAALSPLGMPTATQSQDLLQLLA